MELKSSIDNFMRGVLTKEARPHKQTYPVEKLDELHLQVGVFASGIDGVDLVEYRWGYNGKPLRVAVTRNAMKIDFDLTHLSECHRTRGTACGLKVRAWVEATLKLEGKYPSTKRSIDYEVKLPWPEVLDDGMSFSSEPNRNIIRLYGVPRLFERVDAFIEDGVLSILIYRRIGQRQGFPDGSAWFSEEFSQQVLNKTRQ